MMELIILIVALAFFLFVMDRLNRIAYAAEVAAQYQESLDRKLSALVDQLVDEDTKTEAFAEFNSKPGYRRMRLG